MKRRLDEAHISADADGGGYPNSHSPRPRTLVTVSGVVHQSSYSQPVSASAVQYSLSPTTMPVLGIPEKGGLTGPSSLPGGAAHPGIHQVPQIRQKVHSNIVAAPSHAEQPGFHRLKVEDALSYLDQVKFKFGNQPQVYNDFLDIMKEFKSQSIDTPGVITRVSNLFKGHPELIVGFNTFLPPGYKIEIQANDQGYSFQVSVSVPSPSSSSPALNPTSTTVHHTTTTTHHVINRPSLPPSPALIKTPLIPVGHNNNASPALLTGAASALSGHSISQAQAHQAVTQALIQVESGDTPPHNQPVEFNHAINYVNKIKNRFQGQPEIYKKFLEILHAYQKEQKTFKEMHSNSGKTLTEAEVYAQVAKLFESQEDLLAEFGKFLPDATNHHTFGGVKKNDHLVPRVSSLNVKMPSYSNNNAPSGPVNNNNGSSSSSSPGTGPKYVPPSNSSLLKRSASFSSSVSPMYHSSAKKLKPLTQLRDVSMAEVSKYAKLTDYAFFDKVRKAFNNQQLYDNFLRCMILFNHEVISRLELLQLVNPYLSRFPDLFKWLKDYLNVNDVNTTPLHPSSETIKTEYPKPQTVPHLSLLDIVQPNNIFRQERTIEERIEGGSCSTLDYSNLKRLGASYCALPQNYVQPRCSGRTALCREVLNDTWVSFPSWSEDSTFVTSRKTQFEEYIYRCEDERFELDVVIETNCATITVLENVLKKIARFSADELSKFRLDDCLGGSSPTIHVRALRRVYGDKAQDIIEGVKKNPAVAIPVVLKRLNAKNEEWRDSQKGFNKIWREQNEKFYLKSLDHQGINFKQNDIKQLRSKSLLNEIETLYEERNEQGIENNVGPHLILEYRDKSIIDDAANLLIHHVKRQASIHKEDKQKIKALIRQFIPDLFHHPRQELSDDEKDDIPDNDSLSNPSSPKPDECHDESKKDGEAEEDKADTKNDIKSDEPNEDQQSNKENENDKNSKNTKEMKEREDSIKKEKEEDKKESKLKKEKERSAPSVIPPYPDEHYTLFFGNNNWYLFFRLHQILCDRLSQMYEHASVLAQMESKQKSSRQESTAIALRLKPKTEIEVEDYYPALLDMVKNVLDGNMESTSYEDTLRELFGIHAYIAFTLDKIVSNAVRQLQHLVSDESCIECHDLFLKESKKSATGGMCETAHQRATAELGYQRKSEVAMTDENCFKIVIYKKDCKLTVELIETDSSDNEDEDEKDKNNDKDQDEDNEDDDDDENENDPDQSTQDSEKWSPYEEERYSDKGSLPATEENLMGAKLESEHQEEEEADSQQDTDLEQDTPEQ